MRAAEQSYLDACIGYAKPSHGDKRHFQMRQLGAEFWDGEWKAKVVRREQAGFQGFLLWLVVALLQADIGNGIGVSIGVTSALVL